jgi:DNA-binding CsgD family transcriptional regulator
MNANREILEGWFAAFNSRDLDSLLAAAHPEIQVGPLLNAVTAPPGTSYHGHEGFRSLVTPGFERWPDMVLTPGDFEDIPGGMLVKVDFVLADGVSPATRRSSVQLFRIADDKIHSIHAYETYAEAQAAVAAGPAYTLTPRERQIIALLAEGMNAEQIAEQLVISPFTVRTHVRNAKERLGARTTGHAIAMVLGTEGGP